MIFRSIILLSIIASTLFHQEATFTSVNRFQKNHPAVYNDSLLIGKVVGITDGDTFKLLLPDHTVVKIRIASIDCPERKQPFSARAKQFTSEAIFEKNIEVVVESKDRWGRFIGKVLYDHKNLGEELLRYGMAWHFVRYSSDQQLQHLEDLAREHKAGLWSDAHPIPPWEWRKGVRTAP